MEKIRNGVPISSTPHPQSNVRRFSDLFGIDTLLALSPITELMPKTKVQPILKTCRRPSALNTVVPKKKKCVIPVKGAASNAVLDELKVNIEMVGKNALSHSRNMYNMFPEPILLDSDEEDKPLSLINAYKYPPTKKAIRTSKSTNSEALESNKAKDKRKKPRSDKRTCKTRTATEHSTSKTNTPKDLRVVVNKIPFDNVVNIQSSRMCNENKKKNAKIAAETSPSIVDLDEKESIFSLVPDNLSDISDANDIQNIPRNLHSFKINHPFDSYNNINCEDKNEVDIGTEKVNRNVRYPKVGRVKDSEIAQNAKQFDRKLSKTSDQKEKKVPIEKTALLSYLQNKEMNGGSKKNTFPEDCVSHFEQVVFKHNKRFGATVAKCLDTGFNDFGYLEILVNNAFIGTRPNTTFVVLEGQVQACQAGAKETFSAGDILHISSDAEYQFKNFNATNARLLYVRDKRPQL